MFLKTATRFGLFSAFSLLLVSSAAAQSVMSRPRTVPDKTQNTIIVQSAAPQTNQQSLVKSTVMSQPRNRAASTLTNEIYVQPTVASRPAAAPASVPAATSAAATSMVAFRGRLQQSMASWYGTPYHYGSEGPSSIDCSALVWRVFNEAGFSFDRASARNYWNNFLPAAEDEKYKFGTLVFFNGLGHVGIVIDENTFYHASSSKGVTYSKFAGYWGKRIVGFRRIPVEQIPAFLETQNAAVR